MKKIYILSSILILSFVNSFAQTTLQQYLQEHVQFPALAKEKNTAGDVIIYFKIDKNGKLSKSYVSQGLGNGCTDAVLKALNKLVDYPDLLEIVTQSSNYKVHVQYKSKNENPIANEFLTFRTDTIIIDKQASLTKNLGFEYVEKMPEFPGGEEAMMKYISKKLKYPELALKNFTRGKVLTNFIIDSTGEVTHVEVVKSIGDGCDEEVIRMMKSMPTWTPGEQNFRKVRVSYTLPITFDFDDNPNIVFQYPRLTSVNDISIYSEQNANPCYKGGLKALTNSIESDVTAYLAQHKIYTNGLIEATFVVDLNGNVEQSKIIHKHSDEVDNLVLEILNKLKFHYINTPEKLTQFKVTIPIR